MVHSWAMRSTRAAAGALGVVLLVGALTGCAADEEPAAEATSVEDYCLAYSEYFQERAALGPQADDAEVIASMKSWAADLERLGPPEEMPEDARAGRKRWLELIGEIDDDATQDDVVALEQDLPEQDMAQVQAFFAFNDQTCPKVDANR